VIACNTFRWTLAILINRIALSLQKLLTLCFASIACRQDATFICQTYRELPLMLMTWPRNCHFGNLDSSLEAGPFKSLLLRYQLNSFAGNTSGLVVRVL
jgi:hypothetical protein